MRKNHPAFRMGDAELVRKHLEFLPVEGNNLVAYRLKENANGDAWEDIIVALNSVKSRQSWLCLKANTQWYARMDL